MITAATNPRSSPLWRTSSTTCLMTKTMPVLPDGVQQHPREGRHEAPSVGAGELQQPDERIQSVTRYLSRTQSATTPSRQVIFFPCS